MNLFFPNPRYRIYGARHQYLKIAGDLAVGRLFTGAGVAELEPAVADFVGAGHAVAMPQARVALYCALRVLLKHRKKVLLSPYTIHDVVNMVVCAGGHPVFVDVRREDCNIDPSLVESLVDDDTGAVLVTHLHGLACDVERIAATCRQRGIPLIEDCAQAFGTSVSGRRVGTFGTVGVFSFGMAKNVNAFYGGMAVTSDADVALAMRDEIRRYPTFPSSALANRAAFCLVGDVLTSKPMFWSFVYWLFRYGYLHDIDALNNRWRGEMAPTIKREMPEENLRKMTSAQARLVAAQLSRVDLDTEVRIRYASLYHEGLSSLPQVLCPPLRTDGSHIYLTYPIQVEDRDALNRFLMLECQDVTVQHLINTADADCFAEWFRECPNARRTAASVLLLPSYPSYGERNVARNIAIIRRFFGA